MGLIASQARAHGVGNGDKDDNRREQGRKGFDCSEMNSAQTKESLGKKPPYEERAGR